MQANKNKGIPCQPEEKKLLPSHQYGRSCHGNSAQFPTAVIQRRRDDVLLGRGNCQWEGNQKFQTVIRHFSERYNDAKTRAEKARVMSEIVGVVHGWGGRFLRVDEDEDEDLETKTDQQHFLEPELNLTKAYAAAEKTSQSVSCEAVKGDSKNSRRKRKRTWTLANRTQIRKKVGQAIRYKLAEQERSEEHVSLSINHNEPQQELNLLSSRNDQRISTHDGREQVMSKTGICDDEKMEIQSTDKPSSIIQQAQKEEGRGLKKSTYCNAPGQTFAHPTVQCSSLSSDSFFMENNNNNNEAALPRTDLPNLDLSIFSQLFDRSNENNNKSNKNRSPDGNEKFCSIRDNPVNDGSLFHKSKHSMHHDSCTGLQPFYFEQQQTMFGSSFKNNKNTFNTPGNSLIFSGLWEDNDQNSNKNEFFPPAPSSSTQILQENSKESSQHEICGALLPSANALVSGPLELNNISVVQDTYPRYQQQGDSYRGVSGIGDGFCLWTSDESHFSEWMNKSRRRKRTRRIENETNQFSELFREISTNSNNVVELSEVAVQSEHDSHHHTIVDDNASSCSTDNSVDVSLSALLFAEQEEEEEEWERELLNRLCGEHPGRQQVQVDHNNANVAQSEESQPPLFRDDELIAVLGHRRSN